jgi:hypothetical protein
MDRAAFLKNLKASRVKLTPLQIDGWDGLVYLRPQTLGEIRDLLVKAPADADKAPTKRDPLFIARSIAQVVRDEAGALLFDPENDAEVKDLMDALADTGPAVSRQINAAWNALNEPSTVEVTPEGNSQADNLS